MKWNNLPTLVLMNSMILSLFCLRKCIYTEFIKRKVLVWFMNFNPGIGIEEVQYPAVMSKTYCLLHTPCRQYHHIPVLSVGRYDYQTLDYDMMMIKLYHPVEVTQSVAPISLPTGPPDGGMLCSVSGWGNMAMGEEGELTTPALTRNDDER